VTINKAPKLSISAEQYYGDLPPEQFNLAQYCLAKSAVQFPDKTALTVVSDLSSSTGVEYWSYFEIEELVLRLANGFNLKGFAKGSRILIRMGNSFDYALAFFAINAAGLVPIPASSLLTSHEIGFLLKNSKAVGIVSDGDLPLPELLADVLSISHDEFNKMKSCERGTYAQTLKDDPAFLIYTSGTSADPKGVLHAQRAIWGRRPMYKDWYDMDSDDVLLHTGAFNWTYTLGTGLFDPWANGASAIVYTGKKDINIWPEIMAKFSPTIMAAVPTLYRQILKYCRLNGDDFPCLRHCLTAGEPMPDLIRSEWKDVTGLDLYEALGMSEVSTYISTSPARASKLGSPGKPQSGRAIAVLPIDGGTEPVALGVTGALCVHNSDPGLMLGYWGLLQVEAMSFRGDWFITGDQAHMDDDGFVWFDGRLDDLMNAMGYRVSPIEIESVLSKFSGVQEAAVCSIEVSIGVEIIVGFILSKDGHQIDFDLLKAFCAQNLASYKIPKQFYSVDGIPRNARGKLDRKKLVELERELRGNSNP